MMAKSLSLSELMEIIRTSGAEEQKAALSLCGLSRPEEAVQNLRSLSEAVSLLPKTLPAWLSETADPDGALSFLEQLAQAWPRENHPTLFEEKLCRRILALTACSPFAGRLLTAHPDLAVILEDEADLARTLTRDDFNARLTPFLTGAETMEEHGAALRRFRKREVLRMAARDLLEKAPVDALARELSDFAECCIRHAVAVVRSELLQRYGTPRDEQGGAVPFCVLGLGKLGGRELNFSSDIDLLYVYGADGMTDGGEDGSLRRISNIEFFTKFGERLTALLSRGTAEGPLFRVDLRLRPEGQNGPVVSSLQTCETYYSLRGATWERQALIKARCVGGEDALATEFSALVSPFVYRKYLDRSAVKNIDEIKRKIEAKVESEKEINVKLGYGGIREIEFTVQILQLLNGGRCEAIRAANTLETLSALVQNHYLTEEDRASLAEHYLFLRRVEHRLQIVEDQQTHRLPDDNEELNLFARRLGLRESNGVSPAEQFLARYRAITRSVRSRFEALFSRSQRISVGEFEWKLMEVLDALDQETRHPEVLNELGFSDGERALEAFWTLSRGSRMELRSSTVRHLFLRLCDRLIPMLREAADPDTALNNLQRLIERYGAKENLYRIFLERPGVLELVVQLASRSNMLTNLMIENPEHFEAIVTPGLLEATRSEEQLNRRIHDLLEGITRPETRQLLLHDVHEEELLRIGTRHLLGLAEIPQTLGEISRLADTLIHAALNEATALVTAKRPWPKSSDGTPLPFALFALGKLGGCELNYSSDLDLVAFYGADHHLHKLENGEISPPEFFTKLCQQFLKIISGVTSRGQLYEVDMRLRPMGRNAPLVVSFEQARDYYQNTAETWERLAFVRVRPVAGDEAFAERMMSEIFSPFVYHTSFTNKELEDILLMRNRLEREAAKGGRRLDIKRGYGGLLDIEFLVQSYQMAFGKFWPELRLTGTKKAIQALRGMKILSNDDAYDLLAALTFFHQLSASLQVVEGSSAKILPEKDLSAARLARELGLDLAAEPDILSKTYLSHAMVVRELYKLLMGALVFDSP